MDWGAVAVVGIGVICTAFGYFFVRNEKLHMETLRTLGVHTTSLEVLVTKTEPLASMQKDISKLQLQIAIVENKVGIHN